jgi:hypothetical protein
MSSLLPVFLVYTLFDKGIATTQYIHIRAQHCHVRGNLALGCDVIDTHGIRIDRIPDEVQVNHLGIHHEDNERLEELVKGLIHFYENQELKNHMLEMMVVLGRSCLGQRGLFVCSSFLGGS